MKLFMKMNHAELLLHTELLLSSKSTLQRKNFWTTIRALGMNCLKASTDKVKQPN